MGVLSEIAITIEGKVPQEQLLQQIAELPWYWQKTTGWESLKHTNEQTKYKI